MPLITSVKELPLTGVKIADLGRLPDERGTFTEVMRVDWKELLGEDSIMQANLSTTYPGIVRAWHRHVKGQTDYFLVLKGSIKICVYNDEEDSPTKGHLVEVVLSEDRMQILRVPGRYWHGFKVISPEQTWLLYFANRLYDYTSPDEERRPWNDQTIVPSVINGRIDDPRCNKPWDWFHPPYR